MIMYNVSFTSTSRLWSADVAVTMNESPSLPVVMSAVRVESCALISRHFATPLDAALLATPGFAIDILVLDAPSAHSKHIEPPTISCILSSSDCSCVGFE